MVMVCRGTDPGHQTHARSGLDLRGFPYLKESPEGLLQPAVRQAVRRSVDQSGHTALVVDAHEGRVALRGPGVAAGRPHDDLDDD
jgi:hypothetical protein